jgi:hypothetical protein
MGDAPGKRAVDVDVRVEDETDLDTVKVRVDVKRREDGALLHIPNPPEHPSPQYAFVLPHQPKTKRHLLGKCFRKLLLGLCAYRIANSNSPTDCSNMSLLHQMDRNAHFEKCSLHQHNTRGRMRIVRYCAWFFFLFNHLSKGANVANHGGIGFY